MTTGRRLFLSYRRDDCAAHAGWLADTLRRQDAGEVFLDVDTIGLGENFVTRIEREIERCDVVLVLIGRDWLTLLDADGEPRIFDELDWVHLEIKSALERDIPVVPVLVEGARMPRPQQLPDAVRSLAFRNGFDLSPARWEADVSRLVSLLPAVQRVAEAVAAPSTAVAADPGPAPLDAAPEDGYGRPGRWRTNRHGTDVAVMAAGLAYPDYLLTSGYVCQDDRAFRDGTTRLGFYGSKSIQREFPFILHRRDHVLFTPDNAARLRTRAEPFDAEVAALIDSSFDPAAGLHCSRVVGQHYGVFCLTGPQDERTIVLEQPIAHPAAVAWTQNQRYLSSDALRAGPRSTEEL